MLERFLERVEFDSYEDFYANYRLTAKDDFNFAYDVVDAWADADAGKRALLWIDDRGGELDLSFSDIKRQSSLAARFFLNLGVKKGEFVMLILRQRYEYWICAVALHKIGAVLIPATNQLTRKDIVYRANAADVVTIVTVDDEQLMNAVKQAMPEAKTVRNAVFVNTEPQDGSIPGGCSPGLNGASVPEGFIDFRRELAKLAAEAASTGAYDFPRPTGELATKATDPLLMYFTSGTTGMPKMVLHNHMYPLGHITTARYWQGAFDGGLHLTVSDSGWAKFGWGKIYGQWLAGSAVFAYDMDRFVPQNMLGVMEKYPITTFCAPPTMYRFMLQEDVKSYDLSSVIRYTTAGEPLNPEVYNQWEARTGLGIIEGFGQSESPVLCANFEWFKPKPGSMGKPSPLYDIVVAGSDLKQCEDGVEGHIVVRGIDVGDGPPGLFKRYYKDEELTNSVMRGGCYDTGDVAWTDSDGHFWFVGRDDDIIKCSGYRIGPFEVESALLEHPAVVECAITAAPDPIRGQVVKATVVLAKGRSPSDALVKELQAHVKKVTAPYKYPRIVDFVDELPKTIGGKIRRGQIREETELETKIATGGATGETSATGATAIRP